MGTMGLEGARSLGCRVRGSVGAGTESRGDVMRGGPELQDPGAAGRDGAGLGGRGGCGRSLARPRPLPN